MNRLLEIDLECPKYSDDVHFMALEAGTRLGPYEIVTPSLQGGMEARTR